ncbi:hypothetical protein [Actinokineospora sp. HUAS TT18]|uniref:hypothetical protein n=1 Tax=Actinokineospora sp. HUAS TT18 TaxID=3447451 RepID=UPI003F526386
MAPDPSLSMDTETIDRVGRHLTAIGGQLAIDWTAFRAAIAADEAGIGSGPIGARYRAEYTPAADAIRAVAGPLPRRYTESGVTAMASARAYSLADGAVAGLFPR